MSCKLTSLILLVILLLAVVVEAGKDYYKVLDVPRDAPISQIKRHFKKLSRVYHPDKNPGDSSASEKFMEIAEAYEILSDEEKRQTYDHYGEEGLKQQQQQQQNAGQNPFGNLFNQFFGGGQQHGKPKTANIEVPLHVTLQDVYNGINIEVDVSKQVVCNHCFGSGAHSSDAIRGCSYCNSKGTIVKQVQIAPGFVQQFQQQCDKCGGKGKIITQTCKICNGKKVKRGNEQYSVSIEKGMFSGQQIVLEEESNESPEADAGNIVFTVHISGHPVFERRENDLYTKFSISLIEALTGFEKKLEHLDHTFIHLKRSGVTQYGFVDTIVGAGMPLIDDHDKHGDLYVEYIVQFPQTVDAGFVKELKSYIDKPERDEF